MTIPIFLGGLPCFRCQCLIDFDPCHCIVLDRRIHIVIGLPHNDDCQICIGSAITGRIQIDICLAIAIGINVDVGYAIAISVNIDIRNAITIPVDVNAWIITGGRNRILFQSA